MTYCKDCGYKHQMDLFPTAYVDNCEQCRKHKTKKNYDLLIVCPNCHKPWRMDLSDWGTMQDSALGRIIPISPICHDCRMEKIS